MEGEQDQGPMETLNTVNNMFHLIWFPIYPKLKLALHISLQTLYVYMTESHDTKVFIFRLLHTAQIKLHLQLKTHKKNAHV